MYAYSIRMSECPVCEHPQCETIEREILEGLPKSMVADDLGIDVADIKKHMDEHFEESTAMAEFEDQSIVYPKNLRDNYDKFDVLRTNMSRLVDRFDVFLERDTLSKEDTDQIVNMAREIRQTTMVMAQLEGEIRNELELTRSQFEELKGAILLALNKEERQKVLRIIDAEVIEEK